MKKELLLHSLKCLSHPLSVAMIVLLIVNDHVLRRVWPSWWTGKLGDLAWLVFAPFLAALFISLIIPHGTLNPKRTVGILSFLVVGAGFILAKCTVPVNALARYLLETITVSPVSMVMDPSDCIALPAFIAGWYVWSKEHTRARSLTFHYGLPLLVLALLSTLANAPVLQHGITCLTQDDEGMILTLAGRPPRTHMSADGGMTWTSVEKLRVTKDDCRQKSPWELPDPRDPAVVYRFVVGEGIFRSDDSAKTWKREMTLQTGDYHSALAKSRQSYLEHIPGPHDAIIDVKTGNVIASMGAEGVLVRDARKGSWNWIALNGYGRMGDEGTAMRIRIISVELFLAILAVFLSLGTLAVLAGKKTPWWVFAMLVLGWGAWLGTVATAPALNRGYGILLTIAALMTTVPLALLLAIWGVIKAIKEGNYLAWYLLTVSGITGILFAVPYMIWAHQGISLYTMASGFSVALVLSSLVAGRAWISRII